MKSTSRSSRTSERARRAVALERSPRHGVRPRRCPGAAAWQQGARARAVLIIERGGEKVLGPRVVRLLEEIHDRGSVRQAALALGLGYRHAIDWIGRLERLLARPLVIRRHGGAAGGGAGLTVDGLMLVRRYRRVSRTLGRIAARAEGAILGETPLDDEHL